MVRFGVSTVVQYCPITFTVRRIRINDLRDRSKAQNPSCGRQLRHTSHPAKTILSQKFIVLRVPSPESTWTYTKTLFRAHLM